jgi:hypothetical protein
MEIDTSRRNLLERTLFGAGYLGVKALATGVPLAVLAKPLRAFGQDYACADKAKAQYLIISTSGGGDPMNANVPGTYDPRFPDIAHAADPSMAATQMNLGSQTVTGAQIWSTLPPWVLDRTSFFHHATLTNNHANHPKVLRGMGATYKQEMLPSMYAKHLASCLGTVQTEPVSVGAGDILTFNGRGLPSVPPTGLRDTLSNPKGALANLQKLRDATLDKIHAHLKDSGTPAQRAFLDDVAVSRRQARTLSDDLLGMLSGITSDRSDGQVVAAVALMRMNVSPVVVIRIEFGGDNHSDLDLMRAEVPQHMTGVGRIATLMETLRQYGMQDQVTFAAMNVFGRTLKKLGTAGRDHWASHHASILIGKGVRGGVVGGLEPKAGDYYATPIDSKTGAAAPGGGDVPFGDTLSALAKTVGRAIGIAQMPLDAQIRGGKPIEAALNV